MYWNLTDQASSNWAESERAKDAGHYSGKRATEREREREREMEREAGRKENIFSHFGQAREREGEMVTQSSGSGGGSRVEQSPV